MHDVRTLIFVGLFAIGYGIYHLYIGLEAGPEKTLSISELEDGKEATGSWIKLRGVVRTDLALDGDSDEPRRMIPVVSEHWTSRHSVGVFIQGHKSDFQVPDLSVRDISGTRVIGMSLGSIFDKRFSQIDVRSVAKPLLIEVGSTPRIIEQRGLYWILGGLAILVLYRALRAWERPSGSS